MTQNLTRVKEFTHLLASGKTKREVMSVMRLNVDQYHDLLARARNHPTHCSELPLAVRYDYRLRNAARRLFVTVGSAESLSRAMSAPDIDWLVNEAGRSNVTCMELIAALISDARSEETE